jgi:GT2 family glycosyltransferase
VLYHWRRSATTASFSELQLKQCVENSRRAKLDYFETVGREAEVDAHPILPHWDFVKFAKPAPEPLVTIIIPTRNRADLLSTCVNGILHRTTYQAIEIIIIDHESTEPETLELLGELARDARVKIVNYQGPFNYSDMNNKAAGEAKGEFICLLNNDIDVIESDWLSEMVALAADPANGAIGAKLLYPDGRVQHAGVGLGFGGVAGHLHIFAASTDMGYYGRLMLRSNVSVVTGACLLVRKTIFDEVGGLDATNLKVAFNDVDFCLKVREHGYRNIWTPHALLLHHESPSRGSDETPENAPRFSKEHGWMIKKWGDKLNRDPFFNLNLSLDSPNFDLAFPPRRAKPWLQNEQASDIG